MLGNSRMQVGPQPRSNIVCEALPVGGLAKNMSNERKVWGVANFGSNPTIKYVGLRRKTCRVVYIFLNPSCFYVGSNFLPKFQSGISQSGLSLEPRKKFAALRHMKKLILNALNLVNHMSFKSYLRSQWFCKIFYYWTRRIFMSGLWKM